MTTEELYNMLQLVCSECLMDRIILIDNSPELLMKSTKVSGNIIVLFDATIPKEESIKKLDKDLTHIIKLIEYNVNSRSDKEKEILEILLCLLKIKKQRPMNLQSEWNPKFKTVDVECLDKAVDSILKPHEDYILKLHDKVTQRIVDEINYMCSHGTTEYVVTFADACNWQKELHEHKMNAITNSNVPRVKKLPNQHINLGLRKVSVKVGNDVPPDPILLQDMIKECFPIVMSDEGIECNGEYIESVSDIETWYKKYGMIHYFEDLNGRVGGIIINLMSYWLTEEFLIRENYKTS